MKNILLLLSILIFASCDFFTSKTKQFDHQQFVENYYKAYEKEDIDFLRKYFIEDNIEWFGKKDPLTNDEVIERHFSKFNKEDFLETNIFNLEIISENNNFSIITFDLQYVKYIKKEDRKESDTQKQWMQITSDGKIVKIDIKDFAIKEKTHSTEEKIKSKYTDRVRQIKEMYKEVKSYSKDGKCKTIRWEEKLEGDVYESLHERKTIKCIYLDNYSKISLNFSLWQSNLDGEYYFKNGKIFFAYIVNEWEDSKDKTRIYFKENGEIEKILVDYGDGNSKVTDHKELDRITNFNLRWLNIAERELNK
ncbi:MAG: hypothetical protein QNK60_02215 [Flavobacteriales bacterium]